MKKTLSFLLVMLTLIGFGQNLQVQNMINYARNKDFVKAKAAADAAAIHEDTRTSSKMWMNRGNVYKAIYSDTSKKVRDIDLEAEEKALDAYINCLKFDKDNIYKDDVKGDIVRSGGAVKRKADYYSYQKNYERALYCYDLLEAALPYDFDQGLKRNNITKDYLLRYKYDLFTKSGDKQKAKEYADKLIAINYKDPKIYNDMVNQSLNQKDTTAALAYIDKGKVLFEDNMDLITAELNIYIARKKTDELKQKLLAAIEISPDNEILHFVLANLYQNTKQTDNAEKEYLKAIELRSTYEPANYNLAVLYYTAGKEWNDKLNALPLRDPKTKDYETKSNENFKKAITYFEASYDLSTDAASKTNTKKILRQLCLRLGETEKAEKYK